MLSVIATLMEVADTMEADSGQVGVERLFLGCCGPGTCGSLLDRASIPL